MSWLAWRMWLDLATRKWRQASQAARTAGRHRNSKQGCLTQAGFVGEHCHQKQPGIFMKDIPSIEDFPGGATEGFGTGRAMVGAECRDSVSGCMERVSTDAVYRSREGVDHWGLGKGDRRGFHPYRSTLTQALGQALFQALDMIN